ncbi:MAG TPA: sugar ABC transporter permease [Clostridiales bacterium]|nr:sugar ABC transporter permease [Clostridiales bacterium]
MTKAGTLREIRKNWQNYALMAPFLILFALFTLIPIIYSVVISFTNFNIFTTPTFVGWDNYLRMFFDDDVFIIAIRNTLIFALITGPVSYVLCFVFAWLINELRPKVRAVVTLIFYAPVLSGTAFTVWSFIFSSDQYGLLNGYLMELGILREPMGWLTDPAYILFVVIFVQLWMSLGTGFLSFIAGLQGVDRTLYEAGLVDGVHNRFQELWYITLPVMKPQLLFGAVMQIVSSFSVADVSVRLAGFPSTQYAAETLVTHIMDYGTVRFEMGYACALACFLFALMYLANKLVTFALGRVGT